MCPFDRPLGGDDVVKIRRDLAVADTSDGDRAAVPRTLDDSVERWADPGELESRLNAVVGCVGNRRGDVVLHRIERDVGAHLPRDLTATVVRFGDEDLLRAGELRCLYCRESDRTTPEDVDRVPGLHPEAPDRVETYGQRVNERTLSELDLVQEERGPAVRR